MSMDDDQMTDWGIQFVSQMDERIIKYSSDDPVKKQWVTGEWSHELTRLCREIDPTITDEQIGWLQEFVSEI